MTTPGITITFNDLSVNHNSYGICKTTLNQNNNNNNDSSAISHCTGIIHPKQSYLILGGSGSGRTTLLRSLSNRTRHDDDDNMVRYNGYSPAELRNNNINPRKIASFAEQTDELLNANMTVEETVRFYCRTSLPSSKVQGKDDHNNIQQQHIDWIIKTLGLEESRHTLCGSNTDKSLSGGQQRRLTIGIALCSKSHILCIDQLTDGLDAQIAQQIVSSLCEWTKENNTAFITTLNQPGKELFECFDNIILLHSGLMIYNGPRAEVLSYMASMGYFKPDDIEVADWLISLILNPKQMLSQQNNYHQLITRQLISSNTSNNNNNNNNITNNKQINILYQQEEVYPKTQHFSNTNNIPMYSNNDNNEINNNYHNRHHNSSFLRSMTQATIITTPPSTTKEMAIFFEKSPQYISMLKEVQKYHNNRHDNNQTTTPSSSPPPAPAAATTTTTKTKQDDKCISLNNLKYLSQHYPIHSNLPFYTTLQIVIGRQILILSRSIPTIIIRLISGCMICLLYGGLFFNIPQESFFMRISALASLTTQVTFANLADIPTTLHSNAIAKKDISDGLYSSWIYSLSILCGAIPICWVETTLFTTIFYFMMGNVLNISSFFTALGLLLLFSLQSNILFSFIATICTTYTQANVIAQTCVSLTAVCAGFFITYNAIPIWLKPVYWLSPPSWVTRSLALNEFKSSRYQQLVPINGSPTTTTSSLQTIGDLYLDAADIFNGSIWISYSIIFCTGLALILFILQCIILQYKSKWFQASQGSKRLPEQVFTERDQIDLDCTDNIDEDDDMDGNDERNINNTNNNNQIDIINTQHEQHVNIIIAGGEGDSINDIFNEQSHDHKSLINIHVVGDLDNDDKTIGRNDNNIDNTTHHNQLQRVIKDGNIVVDVHYDINTNNITTNQLLQPQTATTQQQHFTNIIPIRSNQEHVYRSNQGIRPQQQQQQHHQQEKQQNITKYPNLHLPTLEQYFQTNPSWLSFQNVSYTIKVNDSATSTTMKDKLLLDNISGFAQPGKVLALLGASGSGKTTLLNLLSMRTNIGISTGKILLNGQILTKELFSLHCGFVEQFDNLFQYQNIYNTLLFAARLRLSTHITDDIKIKIVNELMELLDLTPLHDTYVYSLSPAECKKLNIGLELITNPSILFLDECTTGLDGPSAMKIMQILRRIATKLNKTIVCSIHQPSASLAFLFDRICVLSKGQQLYFATTGIRWRNVISYFEQHPNVTSLPDSYNPATWLFQQINGNNTNNNNNNNDNNNNPFVDYFHKSNLFYILQQDLHFINTIIFPTQLVETDCMSNQPNDNNNNNNNNNNDDDVIELVPVEQQHQSVKSNQMKNNIITFQHTTSGSNQQYSNNNTNNNHTLQRFNSSLLQYNQSTLVHHQNNTNQKGNNIDDNNNNNNNNITTTRPSPYKQFRLLFIRNHGQYWSPGLNFNKVRLCIALLLSLLFGCLYYGGSSSVTNIMTQTAFITRLSSFGVIIYFAATVSTASLPCFIETQSVFHREVQSGYYAKWMWATVMFCYEIIWTLPYAIFSGIILYWMNNGPPTASNYLRFILTSYLAILTYISTTMWLGALSGTLSLFSILVGTFMGFSFLFSSINITLSQMASGWKWLVYIMPLHKGVLQSLQLWEDDYDTQVIAIVNNVPTLIPARDFLTSYIGMPFGHYWYAFGYFMAYIFITQLFYHLSVIFLNFDKR